MKAQLFRVYDMRETIHSGMIRCLDQFLNRKEGYETNEWGQREDLMLASLCFDAGDAYYGKGNRICETMEPVFCFYSSLPALLLLLGGREHLSDQAVKKLEILLGQGQERYQKELKKEKINSFHLISLAAMAGWGVYTSDQKTIHAVEEQLEIFRRYCMKVDAPDEFAAPFYSAFQLASLAILADILTDTEAGDTACALENYLWKGILDRCHPMLGQLSGPYSRGYLSELSGHPQAVLGALEAVLGENGPFSMERMLWTEENADRILPHGSLDCMRVHALYFAAVDYHCDQDLILHWKQRNYPCRLLCHTHTDDSYDVSIQHDAAADRPPDYPPAEITQQVLFGENYAVGWADYEYENGMACNNFCFMYEKDGYTRTCFTKLAVDDKQIGEWNTFPGISMRLSACNFPDEGRKTVEETQDGWVIHYKPRGFCKGARSIKLIFAIPEHFGPVDEIRIDGERITDLEPEKKLPLKELKIVDGEFHYCFCPLDENGYWNIERKNHYLCLEWHKEAAEIEWNTLFFLE